MADNDRCEKCHHVWHGLKCRQGYNCHCAGPFDTPIEPPSFVAYGERSADEQPI